MLTTLLLLGGAATVSSLGIPGVAPASPQVAYAQDLGLQYTYGQTIGRDLGFSGRVGNTIINTYGDSVQCGFPPNQGMVNSLGCSLPSASDSVSLGDPNSPTDVSTPLQYISEGYPQQFCKTYADEPMNNGQWAIGITQVHEVDANTGMLFFLINNRTDPNNMILVGSGVSQITMGGGVPICTRLQNPTGAGRARSYWWQAQVEPNFGAYASLTGNDGYIYGFGGMNQRSEIWLNRVPKGQAFNLNAYEYWNGPSKGFTTQRLINPTSDTAVQQGRGQSSMVWNPYLNAYVQMSMVLGGLGISVAKQPQGPWSEWETVYNGPACTTTSCSYGGAMYPWYDTSGKTVVVAYTPAEGVGLQLRMVKLTFA